jgi:hypothetical protein
MFEHGSPETVPVIPKDRLHLNARFPKALTAAHPSNLRKLTTADEVKPILQPTAVLQV